MASCTVCTQSLSPSDTLCATGDKCDSCYLGEILDVPFVFWRCPEHRDATVAWEHGKRSIATCGECGRKSSGERKDGGE